MCVLQSEPQGQPDLKEDPVSKSWGGRDIKRKNVQRSENKCHLTLLLAPPPHPRMCVCLCAHWYAGTRDKFKCWCSSVLWATGICLSLPLQNWECERRLPTLLCLTWIRGFEKCNSAPHACKHYLQGSPPVPTWKIP